MTTGFIGFICHSIDITFTCYIGCVLVCVLIFLSVYIINIIISFDCKWWTCDLYVLELLLHCQLVFICAQLIESAV